MKPSNQEPCRKPYEAFSKEQLVKTVYRTIRRLEILEYKYVRLLWYSDHFLAAKQKQIPSLYQTETIIDLCRDVQGNDTYYDQKGCTVPNDIGEWCINFAMSCNGVCELIIQYLDNPVTIDYVHHFNVFYNTDDYLTNENVYGFTFDEHESTIANLEDAEDECGRQCGSHFIDSSCIDVDTRDQLKKLEDSLDQYISQEEAKSINLSSYSQEAIIDTMRRATIKLESFNTDNPLTWYPIDLSQANANYSRSDIEAIYPQETVDIKTDNLMACHGQIAGILATTRLLKTYVDALRLSEITNFQNTQPSKEPMNKPKPLDALLAEADDAFPSLCV